MESAQTEPTPKFGQSSCTILCVQKRGVVKMDILVMSVFYGYTVVFIVMVLVSLFTQTHSALHL